MTHRLWAVRTGHSALPEDVNCVFDSVSTRRTQPWTNRCSSGSPQAVAKYSLTKCFSKRKVELSVPCCLKYIQSCYTLNHGLLMALLLSIISNKVILPCFFAMYSVIFAEELEGCWKLWGSRNCFQRCTAFSQKFQLNSIWLWDKGEKRQKYEISEGIALVAGLSGSTLRSLGSCCTVNVLRAGSFSPFHRLRMPGLSWKRNLRLPILKSRYIFFLAFSWALFCLIS